MDNQMEAISFLSSTEGFAGNSQDCQTVATHISTVLLLGDKAIKLKKAVRFPYLDFSTPERRLAACYDELRLNRRTAPAIYRAVHRITREDNGRLALNGAGRLVDAAIEMTRFDDDQLFDRLACTDRLTVDQMEQLAAQIARLHETAEVVSGEGAARFERIIRGNERALADCPVFLPSEVADVTRACQFHFQRKTALLDQRARSGRVRRCHGDLHLRNICMINGQPTLFDCLEFNEELATTDVLYDLAFVLMDLWHRKLPLYANILFNRYLDLTGDEDGVALLPLFMAVRAVIRAHVTAMEIAKTELACAWKQSEARSYLDLARDLLAECPAVLVAVGGYSGSGKSTVATRIAPEIGPVPGARILSSDRIRKRLFGVAPQTRLGPEAYAEAISEQVYATITDRAGALVAAGHGVVADAVFDLTLRRDRLAAVAASCNVPFRGLWLDAPADMLMRRVATRKNDPSDATPDVVMDQLVRQSAPTDWLTLQTAGDIEVVSNAARLAVGLPSAIERHAPACSGRRVASAPPAGATRARAVSPEPRRSLDQAALLSRNPPGPTCSTSGARVPPGSRTIIEWRKP
jgi:aminoglycoside phosphotransferase family enzyme/predicted kinase